MDLRIEIAGGKVACKQDGREAFSAPLDRFLEAIIRRSDRMPLPEAIPEGVRFIRGRGEVQLLVMEEKPQVRTVRWLADDSEAPFGRGAAYRTARLAFPFVVVVAVFRYGALTGFQQCFYRTSPLKSRADPLYYPNLYNVANGYGQKCWLCLANLRQDLSALTWNQKVGEIRRHLWGAGFNQSSEVHEGMSYWQVMRVDPRVASLSAWEKESERDPFFPLKVDWKPTGKTIGEVMEEMLAMTCRLRLPSSAEELAQILSSLQNGAADKRAALLAKLTGTKLDSAAD